VPRRPKPRRLWSYTVGQPPAQLTARERRDRGHAIYTRIWTGSENVERKYLCATIRDAKGDIVPALENAAREAAQDRQRQAMGGVADLHERELSLAGLFRRLLHARDGKYATRSPWKADMERFSVVIQDALGRTTRVADLRHSHYRKLWRRLAELHVESKGEKYGPRAAEIIVGALRSAVAWAQTEELVEAGTGLPAREWKRQMREEWEKITAHPIAAPAKPRYTKEEQVKLWAALPKADPRIRLATNLGAELRLGQLPRSRRSDVEPYGGHEAGSVRVHGSGKKRGALVVLSEAERAVLVEAMTDGYLSDLEAEYQRKGTDYYLIPAGKLAKGKARTSNGGRPWGRTGMRKAWRKLEVLAGVAHVEDRNWYGLRRLHADLAEDAETDERVLDKLGGWTDSATRRAYQEQGRTDISEKAAAVRSKIRPAKGGE
jgi:hypothetical protein